MDEISFMITIISSIGASAVTAFATFMIQKSKFQKDFEYDLKGVRTHQTVEYIAKRLLEWEEKPMRKFSTIKHHLKGFEDDQLRQILIRAGAVSFDGPKNADGTREELWGLIERNKDKVFLD